MICRLIRKARRLVELVRWVDRQERQSRRAKVASSSDIDAELDRIEFEGIESLESWADPRRPV